MRIKTFRQHYLDINQEINVFVPILQGAQYNFGFPDLVEIWEFDHTTNQFVLNNREDVNEQIFSLKMPLFKVSMKEIFYYAAHEWQTIFAKAIKI